MFPYRRFFCDSPTILGLRNMLHMLPFQGVGPANAGINIYRCDHYRCHILWLEINPIEEALPKPFFSMSGGDGHVCCPAAVCIQCTWLLKGGWKENDWCPEEAGEDDLLRKKTSRGNGYYTSCAPYFNHMNVFFKSVWQMGIWLK